MGVSKDRGPFLEGAYENYLAVMELLPQVAVVVPTSVQMMQPDLDCPQPSSTGWSNSESPSPRR